ncbi:MAG: TldD/PmbA family protein [Defluviitaleaceae bacterium]|nr:TldD/PmbA family protein [Defluviitaleaceae bacterium]
MLDKNVVMDVLAAALATGGSFAEVFVENTVNYDLALVNNVVERTRSGLDYGVGIRIFDGTNAVYAYTNDSSKDNLIKVAKSAAAAVKERSNTAAKPFTVLDCTNISPAGRVFASAPKSHIVDMLRKGGTAASDFDKLISQTRAVYTDVTTDILIANSDGLWVEDHRVRTRAGISAVASSANEKQTAGRNPGAQKGLEFYDNIDFAALGRDCAEEAVRMLNAKYAPGGKMTVIIDNGFGGVLFHEACGHSLEATGVAKKASEFWDKKGQLIANPIVSAIDDGTIPNAWGSQNVDDEGGKPAKNILIENGILKSFLVDRLNGLKMGEASTGSGRRQNYRFAPTSRMTNTYICAGKSSHDEIIAATESGLYAKRLGGGSVQPATGEFNFAVLEAYMIRDGKICEPMRGASLIGKGAEILKNIDMVGDNMTMEQGVCGSVSGGVPTNCGQPMIRVSEIIVGGRGE